MNKKLQMNLNNTYARHHPLQPLPMIRHDVLLHCMVCSISKKNEVKGLENWQTSSLEEIQWMFYVCDVSII